MEKSDIRKVYGLFQDQARCGCAHPARPLTPRSSTQFLKDYHLEFMFDEGDNAPGMDASTD